MLKPVMRSCRLYTGCRVDRKQASSTLIWVLLGTTRFDSVLNPFRCVINGSLSLIFSSLT